MSLNVVSTATPESFHALQAEYKEARNQARKAEQMAKARAARYNLTLRAKDIAKHKERAKAEEGAQVAQQQKKRSMIKSLAKRISLGGRRSRPGSSKSESTRASRMLLPEESGWRSSRRVPPKKAAASGADKEAATLGLIPIPGMEEEEEEEEDEDEEVVLWMGELAKALESQAAYEINKAIVSAFLMEMAPDLLAQVDQMLDQFEGREEELFDHLAETYPVPESSRQALNDSTLKALEADVPDNAAGAGDGDGDGEEGDEQKYILTLMGNNYGKWAANVQSHVLKHRMIQAGASQEDVNAVLNNHSEML